MKELFSALLRDYATSVSVISEQKRTETRAFIQPVRTVARPARTGHPLGLVEPGQTVYIGPAGVEIEGAVILCGDRRYRVRRSETLLVSDEALYTWGVLTQEAEAPGDA